MNIVERKASCLQAYLLLFCGCMSVLAAVVIAPILPQIQAHFSDVPNAKFLVPITLTAPGLVIACLAPFVGIIADRLGRKNMLVFGLILYCFFGLAPILLDSLHVIIGTRIMVGVSEAIIMTCSVALIGDYFHGLKRERYLALNTTFSSTSAVIFIAVGGALGEFGWRTPFFLYSIAALLAIMSIFFLWEPRSREPQTEEDMAASKTATMQWSPVMQLIVCGVTLVGGIGFMGIQVHIGYLLGAVGTTSPGTIGLIASGGQVAVVIGSLVFRILLRINFGTLSRLGVSFLILGIGYLLVGAAKTQQMAIIGVIVAGIGGGVLLPAMMCWNMNMLPDNKRALGTGAWMAAFFLGQFLTPVVVVGLSEYVGTISNSIHFMGLTILPVALVLVAWTLMYNLFSHRKNIAVS